jgi:hypothetical protein
MLDQNGGSKAGKAELFSFTHAAGQRGQYTYKHCI